MLPGSRREHRLGAAAGPRVALRRRRGGAHGGRLGIDTEFVGERRYRALLCLAQVAVPDA